MISLINTFAATACTPKSGGFLGFPTWYKYLEGVEVLNRTGNGNASSDCVVRISHINDFWLVAAALIEILLRVGAIIAIIMVIVGGVQYITSEGKPDKTASALKTIISAAVGLAITVSASALVVFIAGRIK